MVTEIMRNQTPEEQELSIKLSALTEFEAELAQRELDLATIQAELHIFEANYIRIVGVRLAKLDDIEAQIAELEARLKPGNKKIQEQAAQARTQAQKSAEAIEMTEEPEKEKFKPSKSLKKLYREVAKLIHPDLAVDNEKGRLQRQKLMVDANLAYEKGDETQLRMILAEWRNSPESVKGEGTAAELVRVIRKLAQVKRRLHDIKIELAQLKESDLYRLKKKAEEAEDEGRDLLAELASRVDYDISLANQRLIRKKQEEFYL